ncbi:hypothetical protein IF655_01000 [Streptomyces sp. DSM 110735]|uniref:hypothetical protein n=1 Tax=Streptomyces sp. DSM 110735 TaxID=2775031 RepID=UPI0018F6C896|nr:hypothetical protein [Streptomyces sp. DSM 110735]MBJ7901879.1 hypothetical protein [Streptomyces sp. DSM 110735]
MQDMDSSGMEQWNVAGRAVPMTPSLASDLLSRKTSNRRLYRGHVAALADSMLRGNWQLTHQGIALDGPLETGGVVDGQHRLHAVVKSGMTIPMMVFENVPPETFPVLDTGLRRSAADALSLNGEKDPALLASTVRHVHLYLNFPTESWTGSRARMTNDQVLEALAKDPDGYRQAASIGRQLGPKIFIIPTAAAVGYYVTVDAGTPPRRVDEWLSGLASGAFLGPGDSRLALRNAIAASQGRSSHRRRSTRVQAGLYVKAWNFWLDGREVSTLRLPKSGNLPQPVRLAASPRGEAL